MFQKLKHRWKVNNLNLVLIIFTFAIGGSLCGKAGAGLLNFFEIEKNILWWVIYIITVTIIWPFSVLAVSIPFGQFAFFKNYLQKMGQRMFKQKGSTLNIAIFASGAGSNAQQIIHHFRNNKSIKVKLIVCNNPEAGVLSIAKNEAIPHILIEKEHFFNQDGYLLALQQHQIDFIVLAGFLWKVPSALIKAYPNKIINIHPALLPKYGGKGMYGQHVHKAVIDAKELQSGITIHYVDELYDHGNTILQVTCNIEQGLDDAESLAKKVHILEHKHYATTIEELLHKLQ